MFLGLVSCAGSDETPTSASPPGALPPPPPGPVVDPLTGPVIYPPPASFGYTFILPDGAHGKFTTLETGDLKFTITLPPGLSGVPDRAERFQLQVPFDFMVSPLQDRALVLGFHQFGVSEQAIFNQDELSFICSQNGWFLLAPYGGIDSHYGNVDSQLMVDACLDYMEQFFAYNQERIYTIGFSMGGVSAISWAMRHQDPGGRRAAGVISHMGIVDPVADYNGGSFGLQMLLEDDEHFGGSPTQEPFAWDRITPARGTPELTIDPLQAPIINLLDVPIYLSINTNDPLQALVIQNDALTSYLQSKGVNVGVNRFAGVFDHAWSTLDYSAALNFVDGFSAPGPVPVLGPPVELYADLEQPYRFTEVRGIVPDAHARYKIDVGQPGSNSMGVQGVRGITDLAIDLGALQVDPALPLSLTTYTFDNVPTTLYLKGYATQPTSVLVNNQPPASWSYSATAMELIVQPNFDGSFAVVQIVP